MEYTSFAFKDIALDEEKTHKLELFTFWVKHFAKKICLGCSIFFFDNVNSDGIVLDKASSFRNVLKMEKVKCWSFFSLKTYG